MDALSRFVYFLQAFLIDTVGDIDNSLPLAFIGRNVESNR